jgi:hypothetical protein
MWWRLLTHAATRTPAPPALRPPPAATQRLWRAGRPGATNHEAADLGGWGGGSLIWGGLHAHVLPYGCRWCAMLMVCDKSEIWQL